MKARLYALALLMTGASGAYAQNTPTSQMEKLNRTAVSMPTTVGVGRFISWSLLGTDPENITFDIIKDGTELATGIATKTNYVDTSGTKDSKYQIVAKVDGETVETLDVTEVWDNRYRRMQLSRPDGMTMPDGSTCTYSPNDCSVADVDGDGQLELIVKWDPSNSQDNSFSGYTGNVYIDCYKFDTTGEPMWRIDLGPNIRAGAHYTQFMVYDFDGDGKAEMMLKTAAGSKDATGTYVSEAADDDEIKTVDNTKDWRYTSGNTGKVSGGQEWLTVFNGETGKAIHTVFYRPNRAPSSTGTPTWGGAPGWTFNWDDRSGKTDTSYGNRAERYLATVAYLDGQDKNPSAVFCRGYYSYAYLWAVDFDGSKLSTKWLHASISTTKAYVYDDAGTRIDAQAYSRNARGTSGSKTMYGNGNHNLSVADVDGDGCDEIVWGSAALNNDGTLLYAVGYGHGDAIHLGDLMPSRPGLEVFDVHEESPFGWDLHDAATGEIIYSAVSASDNGRGMCADVDGTHPGAEFWSAAKDGVFNTETGQSISTSIPSTCFRIYWDGDPLEELLDGRYDSGTTACTPTITKWNGSKASNLTTLTEGTSRSCNTTKATPCLQADILGDWREEVILWDGNDPSVINIFSSNMPSDYRVTTLMHDHVYRLGVAWQNVAYNQPPHLGYNLMDQFETRYELTGEGEFEQTVNLGESIEPVKFTWLNCTTAPTLVKSIAPDGTTTTGTTISDGFTYTRTTEPDNEITIEGTPKMEGTYKFAIVSGKNIISSATRTDTIYVHCVDVTGIENVTGNAGGEWIKLNGTQVNDWIEMAFDLKQAQDVNIGIYNMAGAQVYSLTHEVVNKAPLRVFGLSRLPAGIYMLKVESAEGTFAKKLLKR